MSGFTAARPPNSFLSLCRIRSIVPLEDRIGAMKASQGCHRLPLAQLVELRVVFGHRSRFIAKDIGNLSNGNIPEVQIAHQRVPPHMRKPRRFQKCLRILFQLAA